MYVYDNYYLRDVLKKIKNYSHNKKIDKIVKDCEEIDSILDYDIFKQYIIENIKNKPIKNFLSKAEFGGEGLLYGHRKAFFDYAGVSCNNARFIFPHFEHGADLREKILPNMYKELNHSFVYQAPYKNESTHKERPMCPVYNVGPYVLYAKKYYDDNKLSHIKEKNGKTVLLFPAHTFEGAEVTFDKEKFVKDVFNQFKDDYDTILVSVYWNDVDDPIYDLFEKEGAKLVSAGFRGDQNFIVRLRAMIEMADVVASNLIGSYIGYSLALDKPFYMFSDRAELYDASKAGSEDEENMYQKTVDRVFNAFSTLNPDEQLKSEQIAIYEYFWGGKKCFKTPEEARDIIQLSSKLLKAGKGITKGYQEAIKDVLDGENRAKLNEKQVKLLKEALQY